VIDCDHGVPSGIAIPASQPVAEENHEGSAIDTTRDGQRANLLGVPGERREQRIRLTRIDWVIGRRHLRSALQARRDPA
jgi:hypothetical protein